MEFKQLNFQQKAAVEYVGGPILIFAGAGSGKTRVLTYKLLHLLVKKILTPNQIIAVTFTNKAARELKERCERLVDFQKELLQVRTFHGFCARVLRFDGDYVGIPREFSIFDEDDL